MSFIAAGIVPIDEETGIDKDLSAFFTIEYSYFAGKVLSGNSLT